MKSDAMLWRRGRVEGSRVYGSVRVTTPRSHEEVIESRNLAEGKTVPLSHRYRNAVCTSHFGSCCSFNFYALVIIPVHVTLKGYTYATNIRSP